MKRTKYSEMLNQERMSAKGKNPLVKRRIERQERIKEIKTPHFSTKKSSSNYFNLILDSGFQDIEMDIRGLRKVKVTDKTGKTRIELEKKPDHFLSEDGSEKLLIYFKSLVRPDIKLGFSTKEEFLDNMNIIYRNISRYINENLYALGMDTEDKQRNAIMVCVMLCSNIRPVFSRSVEGKENERSHGSINLSGELDFEKEEKFSLEDVKN